MDGYFIDWQTGFAIVIALVASLSMMGFLFYQNTKLLSYCLDLEDKIKHLTS